MIKIKQQLQDLIVEHLSLDSDMNSDERERIIHQTINVLSKRIFVDLLPALSDEDRYVLSDMLSDGDLTDEELDLFLRTVMDRYDGVIRESIKHFFVEMDSISTGARKSLDT